MEGGHRTSKFCGSDVRVRVPHIDMGDIFCAHFRLASPVFVQFEPGQTVTKQELNDRFKEHPMENSRMIKGNVEPSSSVKFDAKCRVPSGMEGGEYDNEVFTCQCWSY